MTAMPEAAIAREAGLEYACIALIVNRAAGRGDVPIHADVETHTVTVRNSTIAVLKAFFGSV
jgi:purine nucleoside phosphorylase